MSEIKIFVTHTPDSKDVCPKIPLFYHVAAGSDFQTEPLAEGMLRDNDGETISGKNKEYCELTTQYWAWKNVQADYYGFCHYRRYFSFSPVMLPEAGCGSLVYPYLDAKTKKALCLEEESIRRKVEAYDFLIAKAVPVQAMYAKTVSDHYRKAPGLKWKDLVLFRKLLCAKYPDMQKAADSYLNGKWFYPCNLFLMKKELFYEYSKMLFQILDEFEHRTDMEFYSREGRRTPGHLGERFAGIYYEYLKQKGGYRLGELQMALIEHTEAGAEEIKSPAKQEIPIVLAADRKYVPALFVCLRSLADYADRGRKYHIYVLHTDIAPEDRQVFREELEEEHIQLDFVNVGNQMSGYRLKAKGKISKETFYRFFILDLLKDCEKAVWLDADVIVRRDVAELYDLDLKGNLIAAALDPDFIGQCSGANLDTKRYCEEVLKLKDPLRYVQAGVLVFRIQALRKKISVAKLMQMAERKVYRYSDQDILNIVCEGRIQNISMAWNLMTDRKHRRYPVICSAPAGILEEYEQARKQPYIIHYAGNPKPWEDPGEEFAQEFWKTARRTPYYEVLLAGISTEKEKVTFAKKAEEIASKAAKKLLPQGSRIRWAVGALYWRWK